jgi:NADPH:quinone reductase-like Zn-dependent oxidoreductase
VKAVALRRPGGPSALEWGEIEDPKPGPGEALVKVRAAGVNRLDVWVRNGTYRVTLPHILGADIAGELAEDAPSGRWKAGTRVVVFPAIFCGHCPACRLGKESLCPTGGIMGRERNGGYAELVAVPEENLYPLPEGVPWTSAAAFPLTYLTAEHALNRAEVLGGETVLVFGASGGLGTAVMARALRRGASVIGVTGSPQLVPHLRTLGASEVLMRGSADLAERVQALTKAKGADVVIDTVGQSTIPSGLKALSRAGRYVLVGVTSGAQVDLELRPLYTRQLSLLGSFVGDRNEFLALMGDLARGRIVPAVHEVLAMSEAAQAHRELDAPHLGKIVLTP